MADSFIQQMKYPIMKTQVLLANMSVKIFCAVEANAASVCLYVSLCRWKFCHKGRRPSSSSSSSRTGIEPSTKKLKNLPLIFLYTFLSGFQLNQRHDATFVKIPKIVSCGENFKHHQSYLLIYNIKTLQKSKILNMGADPLK